MKIARSKKMERKALDAIKAFLSRAPRSVDKWHVSDLLYPRKSYFGRVDPKPMTDLQALYFIAGRAHHGILEACLGPRKRHKRADAGEFQKHGIYYSPDLRMPYPWEIKTTRSQYEPKKGEEKKRYDNYLHQLNMYQAMDETDKGGLLLLYLGLRSGYSFKPALRFYKVIFDAKDRAKKLAWMKSMAAKLSKAVKTRVHKALPLCPKYMCTDCPWFKQCKPWLDDPKRKNIQKGNDE
jgi:hypothetical protein